MSLSLVAFQSVLSASACAFSTSAFFFSMFSENVTLSALKYSGLRPKKSSQAAREREKIYTFIFGGRER